MTLENGFGKSSKEVFGEAKGSVANGNAVTDCNSMYTVERK